MATYSCNIGFFLEENVNRVCNNDGTWDGTNPSCTGDLLPWNKVCSYTDTYISIYLSHIALQQSHVQA